MMPIGLSLGQLLDEGAIMGGGAPSFHNRAPSYDIPQINPWQGFSGPFSSMALGMANPMMPWMGANMQDQQPAANNANLGMGMNPVLSRGGQGMVFPRLPLSGGGMQRMPFQTPPIIPKFPFMGRSR